MVDRRDDTADDGAWGTSAIVSVVGPCAPSRMVDALLDRGDELVTAAPDLMSTRVELALARA
ncbi:MAG: hypothetical protein U0168_10470 [Nannocystaceae bacterium]